MTTYSQTQVYAFAVSAGLPNPSLMAAIAMAESSGDAMRVNSIGCVGLWQINQPVWVKAHPSWTVAYLQNPLNNARAAATVLKEDPHGIGAWEAYTNNAYAKYYSGSSTTATQASYFNPGLIAPLIPGSALVSPNDVTNTLDAAASSAKMAAKAGIWIADPHNWLRVTYVIAGAGLVYVAMLKSVAGSQTVKTVVGAIPK